MKNDFKNVKKIDYPELEKLLNHNYAHLVISNLSNEYEKDIESIIKLFKKENVVSKNFKFDKMYIFEDNNIKNLVIGLEQDENKTTTLPYIQIIFGMNGILIYWLSDFISDLNYKKNSKDNIKI